jgi:hypothetical protein
MATSRDRFDAMDDDALLRHLQAAADERRDQLAMGERAGQLGTPEWIAEIWHEGGLAGRQVLFAATGATRREAMLALAAVLESGG